MKVFKHIGGNGCIVFNGTCYTYVDARRDTRRVDRERIKVVRQGLLVASFTVPLEAAPDTIVALMRNNFQPL